MPYEEEGCLSVPEIFDEVERPAKVRLRYLNYRGETVEEEAEGLYAVCIQHEMDHLNGVLFIDHLSRLKRDRAVAKVKKACRRSRRSALSDRRRRMPIRDDKAPSPVVGPPYDLGPGIRRGER